MKKFSKEQIQQIAVAILFTFLFIFAYFRYFLKPMLSDLKEKKVKIEELSKRAEELEKRANKLDRLKEDYKIAEITWESLKARLPDKRDLPGIIQTITKITQKHQLILTSLSPQPPRGSDLYEEYPFDLRVTGSYHDVARFLVTIGTLERIYRAENLTLSPMGPTPGAAGASVSASMTLITYKYKGS